jgi:hypothetical protein
LLAVSVYVVVVVGDTVLLPDAVTVPMPWSIETTGFAPETIHCRFVDCPELMVPLLAIKPFITGDPGWPTVSIAVAVAEPALLVAVRVYVVVEVGETVGVLFKEGEPTPLSMEIEVAPLIFHCRVADCPVVIVLGFAVKLKR